MTQDIYCPSKHDENSITEQIIHKEYDHYLNNNKNNEDQEDIPTDDDDDNDDEEDEGEEDEEEEEDDIESIISSPPSIIDENIDFDLVYALHTFIAVVEGQATVFKGDALILMDDSNSYWWLIEVLKTRELGYIPAENIETPFERLARLNKHRNVEISAPGSNDLLQSFKQKKNPSKSVTLGPEDEYMIMTFETESTSSYEDNAFFMDSLAIDLINSSDHEYTNDYDSNSDDIIEQITKTSVNNNNILDSDEEDEMDHITNEEHAEIDEFEDAKPDLDDHHFQQRQSNTMHHDNFNQRDMIHPTAMNRAALNDSNNIPINNNNYDNNNSNNTSNNNNNYNNVNMDSETANINYNTITTLGKSKQTSDMEEIRVFKGNIPHSSEYMTFEIGVSTTANELLQLATKRFGLDIDSETMEYYISVQGPDGDVYILLSQDKPVPIFRTLTASLTTPLPRSSMEQQQQIAVTKKRSSNRRRSSSFSSFDQSYYNEDAVTRFYLHQRMKRGREGLVYIKVCLCPKGSLSQQKTKKKKKGKEVDRMDKIMAIQADMQVGTVINNALEKFHVPNATAEHFFGGLGDVRTFTKYRMSVRINYNDLEMPLQATQDISSIFNELQLNWSGDGTLLISDLLFLLYPSSRKKKQRHMAPILHRKNSSNLSSLETFQQQQQQQRRPSILDILMDAPSNNDQFSNNHSQQQDYHSQDEGVGILKPPPNSGQKSSSGIKNDSILASSSLDSFQNHQTSIDSSESNSYKPAEDKVDDYLAMDSTKAHMYHHNKPNSIKQQFKRWVGWGSSSSKPTKRNQVENQNYFFAIPTIEDAINKDSSIVVTKCNHVNGTCPIVKNNQLMHGYPATVNSNEASSSNNYSSNFVTEDLPNASSVDSAIDKHTLQKETIPRKASINTVDSIITQRSSSITNQNEMVVLLTSSLSSSSTSTHSSNNKMVVIDHSQSHQELNINETTSNSSLKTSSIQTNIITTRSIDKTEKLDTMTSFVSALDQDFQNNDLRTLSNISDKSSLVDGSETSSINSEIEHAIVNQMESLGGADDDDDSTTESEYEGLTNIGYQALKNISEKNMREVYNTSNELDSNNNNSNNASENDNAIMDSKSTVHHHSPTTTWQPNHQSSSSTSSTELYVHTSLNNNNNNINYNNNIEANYLGQQQQQQQKQVLNGNHDNPIRSSFQLRSSLDMDTLLLLTHGVEYLNHLENSNWEENESLFNSIHHNDPYVIHPWNSNKSHQKQDDSLQLQSSDLDTINEEKEKNNPVINTDEVQNQPNIKQVTKISEQNDTKDGIDEELHRIITTHIVF